MIKKNTIVQSIFTVILLSLMIIGCASVPLTPDGQSLEGTWVKEDGTTLTFSGKNWELVSIEGAAAGYGTYKFLKNEQINFIIPIMINLKRDGSQNARTPEGVNTKPFQKEAYEKYREVYPDQTLAGNILLSPSTAHYSYGNSIQKYILEGNMFILSEKSLPPSGM
jgi:hypothetical protein